LKILKQFLKILTDFLNIFLPPGRMTFETAAAAAISRP
jgi:hypothetical protein